MATLSTPAELEEGREFFCGWTLHGEPTSDEKRSTLDMPKWFGENKLQPAAFRLCGPKALYREMLDYDSLAPSEELYEPPSERSIGCSVSALTLSTENPITWP